MFHATIRRLAARKLRLLTTGIAIVLGIAFMAGTLVLTDTIGRSFDSMSAGVDAGTHVLVRARSTNDASSIARPELPLSLLPSIRSVAGVADAQPKIEGVAQVTHREGRPLRLPQSMTQPLGRNWIDSDQLNPFRIVAGHEPRSDDEVVIDKAFASKAGIAVDEDVTVVTSGGTKQVKVAGIARWGSLDAPVGASVVLFTAAAAEANLGTPGHADAIAVAAVDGSDQTELAATVRDAVAGDLEVVTGAQVAAETREVTQKNLSFINTFLLAFALVALFVGSFIIYNTFSILVAQRSKETATLRAIGASRRQILTSVLVEAACVGVVAAAVGVAAGIGLAAGSLSLLRATGVDLPADGVALTFTSLSIAFVTGVVITVVSAVLPARRATTVAPVAAMRGVNVDRADRSVKRLLMGVALAALGVSVFVYGMTIPAAAVVGSGAAIVFIGITVLGPVIARPVIAAIGVPVARLHGVPGSLARRNAIRNPKRTSTTAAALMIGVALVSFMTVLSGSAKASVADAVDRGFAGDYVIDPTSMHAAGLPQELVDQVDALPQTKTTVAVRSTVALIDGTKTQLTGTDVERLRALMTIDVVNGDLARLDADHIAIDDETATERSLVLGSTLEVTVPGATPRQLTVTATYRRADLVGSYLLSDTGYRALVASELVSRVFVTRADGVAEGVARAAIEGVVASHPQGAVQDRVGFVTEQTQPIDEMLNIVYALLALAVIIALIGVANTTALSIIERTRELGLLRSVGMSRRQLRSTVRWEAALIALFGAMLGLGIGVLSGGAIVKTLASQGITTLRAPIAELVAIAVFAAIAGAAAAILPARRASRIDILGAVAAD
jgi:putative ABC transport system permease protein